MPHDDPRSGTLDTTGAILATISAAICTIDPRTDALELGPSTSLVDDLALDSLHLVELAVILEGELGIKRFPIQEWIDAESARGDRAFTLGSLASACERCQGF